MLFPSAVLADFGALLTGRTSNFLSREEIKTQYAIENPLNIVATGRFTFHKKNLYFSFYTSDKAERPRTIQFIDETGHILEEIILVQPNRGPSSVYQQATGKVCGVWRRVPRDYRRMLREDQMSVILLWAGKQSKLALAGRISKYPALSTELFSSLLEPSYNSGDSMKGAGGTAIVSASSGATSSIHMTLVLNGLFGAEEIADVALNIRLESADRKQTVLNDSVLVRKPVHDYNVVEFSSPVSIHDLRMLTRGKLLLTVESRKQPKALHIQGPILTRVTCELFETVLAPSSAESKTRSSGLAWMYLNRDGSLVYNIRTEDLNLQENPLITLVDDSAKRRTEVEDLTSSFSFNNAVGVVDRLGPRVLEPLYADKLAVNIATENDVNLIRGVLIARQVADARDSNEPILLKRIDATTPAHLTGMAWIAVDNECTLHYEITLSGVAHHQEMELYLEEKPVEAPGAPTTSKILEEFSSHYLEGFVIGMSSYELAKLDIESSNIKYLQIKSKGDGEIILKGKLNSTKIPSHCMPEDNNVPSVHSPNDHTDNNVPTMDTKCRHSGRFFDEGDQWRNEEESCSMCACIYGRVICEAFKCPPLNCKDVHPPRGGECCGSCASKFMPQSSQVDVSELNEFLSSLQLQKT